MGTLQKLMQAGIVAAGAALTQADQDLINGLTDQEVSALISIKSKLSPDFVQRHLSATDTRGGAQTIGIVF